MSVLGWRSDDDHAMRLGPLALVVGDDHMAWLPSFNHQMIVVSSAYEGSTMVSERLALG